jgi:fatty acid CoA ligase FadD9
VVNPHDDGVSLGTFVDWLIDLGWPIQRIDDYADWRVRFGSALRQLPESARRHSAAPILNAFDRPAEPVAGSPVPADDFCARVRTELGEVPGLSSALATKYVADLQDLALLPIRQRR